MHRSHKFFHIIKSRAAAFVAVFFFGAVAFAVHQSTPASPKVVSSLTARSRVMENYARLPLSFEPNRGQANSQVDFLTRGSGFEAMLDKSGATLLVGGAPQAVLPSGHHQSAAAPEKPSHIRMTLVGASSTARSESEGLLPGVVNYYLGSDSAKWRRNIPTYRQVKYSAVYSGIDLAYYGDRGAFEFDFNLQPGADPRQIALALDGANSARVGSDGNVIVKTGKGDLTLKRPLAYQQIDGIRREVRADYKIAKSSAAAKSANITIALGDYDHSKPLTIDPMLVFSTFFGGTTTEIQGVAIDGPGNVYVTGWAFNECSGCAPFPSTGGQAYDGASDAFVARLNANGSAIQYATLIGGSAFDEGTTIAVDGAGNAYIAGQTFSTNFPRTTGPTSAPGAGDAFVAKFDTSGAVAWATYLGGSAFDRAFSIAVPQGCVSGCNPYVAGETFSSNFPNTGSSGFMGADDAFITELAADGSSNVYSVLLAGSQGQTGARSANSFAIGIAVDSAGAAYVTGGSDATDFPKTIGPGPAGSTDAFAAKLSSTGTVSYARLLGGADHDEGFGIAIPPACTPPCNAYIEGVTFSSSATFVPVSTGSTTTGASLFVTELASDASGAVYSTFVGAADLPTFGATNGIAVDSAGDAYVAASTSSQIFPLLNQVEGAPGHAGSLLNFAASGMSTSNPAWSSASNGSPLAIQSASSSGPAYDVATTTGIFATTDGSTFTQLTATGLPAGPVSALAVDPDSSPTAIFAGGPAGLYLSTDSGNTFSPTFLTGAHGQSIPMVQDIDSGPGPLNARQVIAGTIGNGAWGSTDGGTTFAQIATIPTTATVTSLTANDTGNSPSVTAFIGTTRGVYTSSDVLASFPGHWSVTKLTSPAVASMNADRNSTPPVDYAGTYFQGVYESTDSFQTFISANIPLLAITSQAIDRDNSTTPSTIYVGLTSHQQASIYENTAGYGAAFVATNRSGLPGSIKAIKSSFAGELLEFHPVIAELNPSGSAIVFSTYLASTTSWDEPGGIAVDAAGSNIYIAGTTYGSNFPIAGPTPAGSVYEGFSSGFISKIGPGGPTVTATPTAAATATATATQTATPTATATPDGAKIIAPSKVVLRSEGIGTGATSTAKVLIKNGGKTGSLIGNISLSNNQPGTAFTLSSPGPFDIAVRGTLTEIITFKPDATSDGAMLSITSNDPTPARAALNIPVTGIGLAGRLVVARALVIRSPGVGQTGSANLVLRNVGKGILMGAVASATSPFGGGGGMGTIQPGKTNPSPITITFTPTATGVVKQPLVITVMSPSTPATATVTLEGIAK